MALMFTETASIKKAVNLINEVDTARFTRLLLRIIQKLHLRDEQSFTEDEEDKLEDALDMQRKDLQLVLETTAFIIEQAAYHLAKPANLAQQLQNINLSEEKASLFAKAWTAQGKDVVEKLRKRTLSPNQLTDVNWRLNLQMAQQSQSKLKTPSAMLELGVTTDGGEKERIRMEFTHQELFSFYNQLETIQGQLDALS